MSYDDDDVKNWVISVRKERLSEAFSPMRSLADLGPDRYDELARRQLVEPIVKVLEGVIDGTFGEYVAEAHTSHNELYELAEEMAATLVVSDKWKNIAGRIKRRPDVNLQERWLKRGTDPVQQMVKRSLSTLADQWKVLRSNAANDWQFADASREVNALVDEIVERYELEHRIEVNEDLRQRVHDAVWDAL